MFRVMEEDRIQRALARIEAAAVRIEQAGRRAAASATPSNIADPDLERRHAALRKETAVAIAELDALIAKASA